MVATAPKFIAKLVRRLGRRHGAVKFFDKAGACGSRVPAPDRGSRVHLPPLFAGLVFATRVDSQSGSGTDHNHPPVGSATAASLPASLTAPSEFGRCPIRSRSRLARPAPPRVRCPAGKVLPDRSAQSRPSPPSPPSPPSMTHPMAPPATGGPDAAKAHGAGRPSRPTPRFGLITNDRHLVLRRPGRSPLGPRRDLCPHDRISQATSAMRRSKPRRFCRRLRHLSRMQHHERNFEQVFRSGARARRSHGSER